MKIKQTLIAFAMIMGIGSFVYSPVVNADCGGVETSIINCSGDSSKTYVCYNGSTPGTDGKCNDGSMPTLRGATCPAGTTGPGTDGLCSDKTSPTVKGADVSNNPIWGLLLLIINILTAGIGVAAVGGVVYGSILYASAGGSMDQTKRAKTMIFNVVIGLVVYALMYSLMNYLIPGGIFS